jgi:phage recombination protein Bet
MSAILPASAVSVPALMMDEGELMSVLRNSLYPGAADASIKLVIGWCKAQNKDPLKRPVHIVPMNVKKPGTKDQYEWRDVLLPGIGDYRTDAARTGEYAGIGQAVFGPDKTLKIDEFEFVYPEWCEVSVFRMVRGVRCEFSSGKVYWLETYATAGKDSMAPNKMWRKRPRGQIEKCAEAMALRRAFPEVGAQPTADEMEGKTIEVDVTPDMPQIEQPRAKSTPPASAKPAAEPDGEADSGPPANPLANDKRLAFLRKLAAAKEISESHICEFLSVETLDGITVKQAEAATAWIRGDEHAGA